MAFLATPKLAVRAEGPGSQPFVGHEAHDQVAHAGEVAHKAQRLLEFGDATICSLASQADNLYFVKGPGPPPPEDIFDGTKTNAGYNLKKASPTQNARFEFELWRVPKAGGEPTYVLRESRFESAPAFDQDFVFFLGDNGDLRRASLGGGPTVTIVKHHSVASLAGPIRRRDEGGVDDVDVEDLCQDSTHGVPRLPPSVVVDAKYVFWLDVRRGALLRVSKLGGRPSLMAKGLRLGAHLGELAEYARLAQDDRGIYFITDDGQGARLMMVDKKRPGTAKQVVQLKDSPLRFAVGAAGVLWVDDEEVVSPSGATTFHLRSSRSRADGLQSGRHDRLCDFATDRNGVVFSECGEEGSVVVQSLSEAQPRRIVTGTPSPVDLIPDLDAVYFVDVGSKASFKARRGRVGCCSIWRAFR